MKKQNEAGKANRVAPVQTIYRFGSRQSIFSLIPYQLLSVELSERRAVAYVYFGDGFSQEITLVLTLYSLLHEVFFTLSKILKYISKIVILCLFDLPRKNSLRKLPKSTDTWCYRLNSVWFTNGTCNPKSCEERMCRARTMQAFVWIYGVAYNPIWNTKNCKTPQMAHELAIK